MDESASNCDNTANIVSQAARGSSARHERRRPDASRIQRTVELWHVGVDAFVDGSKQPQFQHVGQPTARLLHADARRHEHALPSPSRRPPHAELWHGDQHTAFSTHFGRHLACWPAIRLLSRIPRTSAAAHAAADFPEPQSLPDASTAGLPAPPFLPTAFVRRRGQPCRRTERRRCQHGRWHAAAAAAAASSSVASTPVPPSSHTANDAAPACTSFRRQVRTIRILRSNHTMANDATDSAFMSHSMLRRP